MALLMVSYDLMKRGQEYPKIAKRLDEWGGLRVLTSQWLVRADVSASSLRDDLLAHVNANDRLFVTALTAGTAWRTLLPSDDVVRHYIQGK